MVKGSEREKGIGGKEGIREEGKKGRREEGKKGKLQKHNGLCSIWMKRNGFCFFWVSSGLIQMSDRTIFDSAKVNGFHGIGVLEQGVLESKGHDPLRGKGQFRGQ